MEEEGILEDGEVRVKEMEAVEDLPEAVHQTFGAVEDLPGADIVVVDAV